jgi:deoxyribodipyrimidine photo-lyase
MKPFSLSIHLFRRDLRLEDNTALLAALSQSDKVLPVFIFDDRQLSNAYKGDNSYQFMLNSLMELDEALRERGSKLYLFRGIAHRVLSELLWKLEVDALFVNRDYTPFSLERDIKLAKVCQEHQLQFLNYADALLNEPEQVHKDDGLPYTIFTPFLKKARLLGIPKPVSNNFSNYFTGDIAISSLTELNQQLPELLNTDLLLQGGRKEGLNLLNGVNSLHNYDDERNLPSVKGTSLLSAHHKFGTISIRESYHHIAFVFGKEHALIAELYWRDFFTHVVFHFPRVLGHAFKSKYENIGWSNDEVKYELWCKGQTGFPIVDAGMRELVTTGFMHNRVRMIVASFLTKDLHIDWRWGERFFANHLIDYDPAVNNGNWQWAASTGCDAQPYFRIFNPWRQQLKFDPKCVYIKKWLPELQNLSAKEIHNWEKPNALPVKYPRPIVDHKTVAQIVRQLFKERL